MTHRPDNPFRPTDVAAETAPPTHESPFFFPDDHPFSRLVRPGDGLIHAHHYQDLAASFSFPESGYYARRHPAYQRITAAVSRADTLAESLPSRVPQTVTDDAGYGRIRHLDFDHPAASMYLAAVQEVSDALAAVAEALAFARNYKHPETGYRWHHVLEERIQGDRVAQAAADVIRDQKDSAILTLTPPSLDDHQDVDWLIDGLLPWGGTALVVGATGAGKTHLATMLAEAVADDRPFLGHDVATDHVVVIDTSTAPSVLKMIYADALAAGADLRPFHGRTADLDVTDAVRRRWLARFIPAGSLIVVDSLPPLLAAFGMAETSNDVSLFLLGLAALAAETGAAGLVVVHASPESNASRPRGSGSIASWPDMLWVVTSSSRGKHTLAVTGLGESEKLSLDEEPDDDDDDVPAGPKFSQPGVIPSSSPADEAILEAVATSPGMTTSQVALGVSKPLTTVDRRLKKMEAAGVVSKTKGTGRGQATHWWPAKK